MRAWKDNVITQLTDGLAHLCAQRDVRLVQARATFTGVDTVHLAGAETHRITFQHGILATGSRPIPLPGTTCTDRIMDASKALELEDIPKRLPVIRSPKLSERLPKSSSAAPRTSCHGKRRHPSSFLTCSRP
jgi:dihydrolipoamide dehydrogenase